MVGGGGVLRRPKGRRLNQRVLFVDDEPNILEGIQRTLRKQVELQTASSGAEALRLIGESGPFAVVVSDMRMPAMNGAQFLARVREREPDTVRMILSGHADLEATIAAVNEAQIYQFLTKPCATDRLLAAVEDGLNQHRLLTAEKVLLEQTLSGAVKMLIEILGMVSPAASSRVARLQRYTIELSAVLGLASRWEWGLAAFVSQIGCVALPKEMLFKVEACQRLNEEENRLYESHPEVAGKLLAAIPRLEDVAAIVTAQFGSLNAGALADERRQWDVGKACQVLLHADIKYDRLVSHGASRDSALNTLRQSTLRLPATVLKALARLSTTLKGILVRQIRLADLTVGMTLDEDLVSP